MTRIVCLARGRLYSYVGRRGHMGRKHAGKILFGGGSLHKVLAVVCSLALCMTFCLPSAQAIAATAGAQQGTAVESAQEVCADGAGAVQGEKVASSLQAQPLEGGQYEIKVSSFKTTGSNLLETIKQDVTVKNPDSEKLTLDTDYTLTFTDAEGNAVSEIVNKGTYTVAAAGKGTYADAFTNLTATFGSRRF